MTFPTRRLVIAVRADPVICGHSGEARNLAEVALTRGYDEPPTWQRLLDDLAPEALQELGTLYDALPAGAQEEYARRFGVPSAV